MSGIQTPVGARFSTLNETGPKVSPTSCMMATRALFREVMHLGCSTDHPPHSGTEVKEKVQLYVNHLPLCFHGML
jgi:hypothetical protein